jgi:hypothetical protein
MHAGLTGRKTAINAYGEYVRHSGAALSGKDPTRIDRIGAYAARHAGKVCGGSGAWVSYFFSDLDLDQPSRSRAGCLITEPLHPGSVCVRCATKAATGRSAAGGVSRGQRTLVRRWRQSTVPSPRLWSWGSSIDQRGGGVSARSSWN